MPRFSLRKIGLVLLISFALLGVSNLGHALLAASQPSQSTNTERSKSHCHSACFVSSKEVSTKLVVRDKDDDPQPQFFELVNPFILASLYAVLISSLFYKFYNRKPPDLFAQTATWRM